MTRQIPLALCFVALTLGACGPTYERNPVPIDRAYDAVVPGIPEARFVGTRELGSSEHVGRLRRVLRDQMTASGLIDEPINILAISGGGADGAFAVGLLAGWTERGDRPEFTYVSGISTGSLIAPFAFLGSEYDDEIKTYYTTLRTRDLIKSRGFLGAIMSDAFSSTKGLRKIIDENFTQEMVDEIAAEHRRGRRLFMGTTNLDLMSIVYWNIGLIAASGHPGSLQLIKDIMLASCSIPGVFPPTYIDVEIDGEIYDEMHVDGGATVQVFAYPGVLDLDGLYRGVGLSTEDAQLYVIRNSRRKSRPEVVEPKLFSIVGRSVSSVIRMQGIGNLYQLYLVARRDGFGFNVAIIGEDFDAESSEEFDPEYMIALYEYGKRRMLDGRAWLPLPPNYVEDETEPAD